MEREDAILLIVEVFSNVVYVILSVVGVLDAIQQVLSDVWALREEHELGLRQGHVASRECQLEGGEG